MPEVQRTWLARMLYALPPRTLSTLRMAIAEDRIYLLDRGGIEGVPLGVFYSEVAERIYVPSGMTLVPAVAPTVLADLVSDAQGGHVFFEPESNTPRVVPANAFGPVSRQVLRDVAGTVVHADAPDRVDPPLPLMQYGDARRFPLWGVPGKDLPVTSSDGADEGLMADTEKLQRRYDALIADFVSPLVTGGTVMLHQAVAPGSIGYFEHANTGDANANREIFDALHRVASTIAPVQTVPWPDRDLLLLAMAAHNLVLITDPEMDRVFARGARRKIVDWIDDIIDAIAPPNTRG